MNQEILKRYTENTYFSSGLHKTLKKELTAKQKQHFEF